MAGQQSVWADYGSRERGRLVLKLELQKRAHFPSRFIPTNRDFTELKYCPNGSCRTEFLSEVSVDPRRQLTIRAKPVSDLICSYCLSSLFVRALRTIPGLPVTFGSMVKTIAVKRAEYILVT